MFNIIKQQKQIFSNLILSFFEGFEGNGDIAGLGNVVVEKKELSTEELKEVNLDKMFDLIISREIDLKKEDHKEFIKNFLIELSKKNGIDGIQEDDVNSSIFSIERQAFNKVINLLKTLERYKNVESQLRGYTQAELNMLNEFIGQTLVVKQETQKQIDKLSYELDPKNPEHIYRFLFDFNSDNIVDKKDKNILNNDSILAYVEKMIKDGKETQLLSSISHILGEEVSSKEDLYNLIGKYPEKRGEFIQKLSTLSQTVFVTDILEYGSDAIKKSLEKKQNIERYIDSLFEEKKEDFYRNYDKAIADFENKLSSEDKEKYQTLLAKLNSEESKKSIFDNFKLNGAGVLISLVNTRKGAGMGFSLSNSEFDKYLREMTNDIVFGANFNIGVASIGGVITSGIGIDFNFQKSFSDTIKGFASLGMINLIPFALVGVDNNINKEDFKKSGFIDLDNDARYVGFTFNFMPLGQGGGLHYKTDKLEGIMQQENNFSKFLDEFITPTGLNENIIKMQNDYEKNKNDYNKLLSNIKESFRIIGFDNLKVDKKKYIIDGIKKGYINHWRQNVLMKAMKEGYNLSLFGIGIQFIAGFSPLPYIGAIWSKVDLNYTKDEYSQNMAIIAELVTTKKIEKMINNTIFESTENIFMDNMNLFESIAIRNPRDWPRLIEAKSFDERIEAIISILKTDKYRNTKVFKKLLQEFQTLKLSVKEEDRIKLNILVAQFQSVSFKDKRSIEEVIIGFTKDSNGRYEGTYDFIFGINGKNSRYKAVGKFSKELGLSDDFLTETNSLYEEVKRSTILDFIRNNKNYNFGDLEQRILNSTKISLDDVRKFLRVIRNDIDKLKISQVKKPDLYGFVASYKVDAIGKKRLATGFVDMPAGQVTVAGGKETPVINQNDINWITERFVDSEYGSKSMNQIQYILRQNGIDLSKDEFKNLLSTGSIDKDGKNIKLDREFVTFLYGICSNESIGVRLKSLIINHKTTINFGDVGSDGILKINANTTNISEGDKSSFSVGIVGGKDEKNTPSGGSGGSSTLGSVGSSNSGGGIKDPGSDGAQGW